MVDHSGMKLGKRAPRFDGKRLKLRDYLPTLPPLPDQQDWIGAITAWGMMLNDDLSDCIFAGFGHAIQTWTANVGDGTMITVPDADILKLYEDWTGYNPADPSTDQGYFEVDALNNFRKLGFAGHKLLAYADPDPGNLDHVKASIMLLGGIYIGLNLPLSAQGEEVWSSTSDDPGTWGGHAVWVPRYRTASDGSTIFTCVTWGEPKDMTQEFWLKYTDESHALVSPDFATISDVAASGFNLAQLQEDLQTLAA